jgi:hypothetical protein
VRRTRSLHDDALHFAHGHYWQRPEVSLTGALEIAFVIKFLDGLLGRITVGEVVRERERANAGLNALSLGIHGLLLRGSVPYAPLAAHFTLTMSSGFHVLSKNACVGA